MGGSASVNTAKMLTESIIDVSNKTQSSTNTQVVQRTHIKNSVIAGSDISREFEITVKSLAKFNIDNSIIDEIVDNMKAKADSESSIFTGSAAINYSEIKTVLRKNFKNEMVTSCSTTIYNDLFIEGSAILNTRINDRFKVLVNCITNNMLKNKNISDMTRKMDSGAESISNLLSFGIGGTVIMVVIIIAIVMIVQSQSEGSSSGPSYSMPPQVRGALMANKMKGFMR